MSGLLWGFSMVFCALYIATSDDIFFIATHIYVAAIVIHRAVVERPASRQETAA